MSTRFNPWRQFHGAFVPEWLMRSRVVSAGAKLCYARLCRYAGKEGVAWPDQKELAEELAVDVRTVQRYIRELSEGGLIEVEQVGLNRPNRYHFLWAPMIDGDDPDTTDVSSPDTTDVAGPDTTDVSRPSSLRESATRVTSVALRATVERKPRPARSKRAVADPDEGLASNRMPDDDPAPTDLRAFRAKRKPSTFTVVEEFTARALEDTSVPAAQRNTVKGAFGKWIKKQIEQGVTHAELLAAMDLFFASAKSFTRPGDELWKGFMGRFAQLHRRASEPDITDLAYYTDSQEQENIEWTAEAWLAAQEQ